MRTFAFFNSHLVELIFKNRRLRVIQHKILYLLLLPLFPGNFLSSYLMESPHSFDLITVFRCNFNNAVTKSLATMLAPWYLAEHQVGNEPNIKTQTNTNKYITLNLLNANPTKWSNTLKQFVGCYTTNCLSVFGHFLGLAFKELMMDGKILSGTLTLYY